MAKGGKNLYLEAEIKDKNVVAWIRKDYIPSAREAAVVTREWSQGMAREAEWSGKAAQAGKAAVAERKRTLTEQRNATVSIMGLMGALGGQLVATEDKVTEKTEGGAKRRNSARKTEETHLQRLKRIQDDWEASFNDRKVTITLPPNTYFKGQQPPAQPEYFGPARAPRAELSPAVKAQMQAERDAWMDVWKSEEQKLLARKRGADAQVSVVAMTEKQKADIVRREELQIARLRYDTEYALATRLNDQFDRFRAVEVAKSNLLREQLQIRYANSERLGKMLEMLENRTQLRLGAIEKRRGEFGNTPFQQMLKKMGPLAQQSGYQVGDLFTQIAGGQNIMLAATQQGSQLAQSFTMIGGKAMWLGPLIGAGISILGALAMMFLRAKDGAEKFSNALARADYEGFQRSAARFSASLAELSAAQVKLNADVARAQDPLQRYDGYMRAKLEISVRAATKALQENRAEVNRQSQALTSLFGSVEAAAAAYERLQSQTSKGLKIEAQISGLELKGEGVENEKEIQRIRNEARLEEVLRGYDRERVAVQGWERKKSEDGEKFLETEAEFASRRSAEIARINKDEQEAKASLAIIGSNAVRKIQIDAGRQSREEQRKNLEAARQQIQEYRDREIAEAVAYENQKATATAELRLRSMRARGDGEVALQAEQHRVEMENLKRQLEDEAAERGLSVGWYKEYQARIKALQDTQAEEIKKTTKDVADKEKKEAEARTKTILDENAKIRASYAQIAGTIADTWKIGPLQKVLAWYQRIESTLQAIRTIQMAMATLKGLGVAANPIGSLFSGIFGGAFAEGGRPPLGRISVVGERGPELFIPDQPGTILSNRDSRGALGKSVSYNFAGDTIVVHGDISPARQREIGRGIAEAKLNHLRQHENATRQAVVQGVPG